MSDLNKFGFYNVSFFLGIYYGIIPLLDIEVWIRNSGWIKISYKQAIINILISIFIIFVLKRLNKNKK